MDKRIRINAIWKSIYLVGFFGCLWFGMTQLNQNTESLKNQSVSYSNRHNSINVRFKTVISPNLKLTARPEHQGHTAIANQVKSIRFFLKNLSSQKIEFVQKMFLQTKSNQNLVEFSPLESKKRITLGSGEARELNWKYKINNIGSDSFDTVSLALVINESSPSHTTQRPSTRGSH